MKQFKAGVFISMLFIAPVLKAQNPVESYFDNNLEELSTDEEEKNWDNELDNLSDDLKEPININTATKEILGKYPFLTDLQIENILAYIYIHVEGISATASY